MAGWEKSPGSERNARAAVTAINASGLALRSDGSHRVQRDRAIAAMKATGRDMRSKYKETARGGLAVSLSLIHISDPTTPYSISYAVFCLKKKA